MGKKSKPNLTVVQGGLPAHAPRIPSERPNLRLIMGGASNVISDEQFDPTMYSPMEVIDRPEVKPEGTSKKKQPKQRKHDRSYRQGDYEDYDYYD